MGDRFRKLLVGIFLVLSLGIGAQTVRNVYVDIGLGTGLLEVS